MHRFGSLLRGLRLKATPRRLAILDILADESVYLSPEQVWQKLRRKFRRVGLPTVYRNLDELAQNGLIIKIVHPDRRLYYYLCLRTEHHHHFVCISCRKVEDLTFCGLDAIEKEVKRNLKGAVVSHILQVYGHCKTCLKG